MKKIILISFLLFNSLIFANQEKKTTSTITKVNVFINKAEIERKASTSVLAGITDIILTDLSRNIDPNSIQVSGTGNAVIMSVSHQINHLNKAAKSEKVKVLEKQINELNEQTIVIRYNKEALQEEKNMILSNKSIGGANTGVNWEQLENIADFYRERLVEISTKWTEFDKQEKDNNKKHQELSRQLKTLTTSLNKPTSEIIVKVHTKRQENISLTFNYLVYNAGWTPLYDFRAQDGNSKIDVSFRANVHQNTGVDWTNVPLTLSTGNPSQGIIKPELNPWYLYLQEVRDKYKKKSLAYGSVPARQKEIVFDVSEENEMDDMGWGDDASNAISTTSSFVNTSMKQLSTEYTITLKQNILSNNKKHMVNVKDFQIDAEYEHAAVPKLEKDAFLMANLVNWEEYDWISSEINVFYDGTFVGKSYIDISQVSDTINLSLGRDKKVSITREKIKDYCKTKSIGSQRKKLTGYEIIVRNNKRTNIKLNLQDQIPVSQQEQIEVKIIDVSGAKKNETTGFLDWDVNLKPGEVKKLYIKYEVKYPKKYMIPNL